MTTPKSMRSRMLWQTVPVVLLACTLSLPVQAETYTLAQLKQLVLKDHPDLGASQAQIESAKAGLVTAKAYPNPELEFNGGPMTPRHGGTSRGATLGLGIAQPLDMPTLREKRGALANRHIERSEAALNATRVNLLLQVEQAYFEILRLEQAQQITLEGVEQLMQVRERVMLRVKIGEAPNYDLIKAEAEMLNANRIHETNMLRLEQARTHLRALLGYAVEEDFDLVKTEFNTAPLPERDELWKEIESRNPDLIQTQSDTRIAQARLALEQQLRTPQVTVRALFEQEPEMRSWRIGASLPLPLWNQRQGQIREAAAGVNQAESQHARKLLELRQALNAAYSRYEIARTQVNTYENGLLREASAALRVAEAAYRFGERGILDYLDTQRTYRMVSLDYHNARFELQAALLDIAKLRAQELHGDTQ